MLIKSIHAHYRFGDNNNAATIIFSSADAHL